MDGEALLDDLLILLNLAGDTAIVLFTKRDVQLLEIGLLFSFAGEEMELFIIAGADAGDELWDFKGVRITGIEVVRQRATIAGDAASKKLQPCKILDDSLKWSAG